jgi:hypothetical protein
MVRYLTFPIVSLFLMLLSVGVIYCWLSLVVE